MLSLASTEQIQQQGCPVSVKVTIRAPQNGQSSLESTPILSEYQATLNGVQPQFFHEATQHLTEQLSQLAQQEIQQQFGMPTGGRGSRTGQPWGGQGREASGGGRG